MCALCCSKTVIAQDSSVAAMLKEQGAKTSKKDLFKEIGKAWHQSSVFFMKKIKANFAKSKQGEGRGRWRHCSCRRARLQSRKQTRRKPGIYRLRKILSRYLSDLFLRACGILGSLFFPRAPFTTLVFYASGDSWTTQKTNPT